MNQTLEEVGQFILGRPSKHVKVRTIQVTILMGFVSLLVVTVVVILSYMYFNNARALLRVSDDLLTQVSETVIEKTGHYLQPAGEMSEVGAWLLREGAVDIDRPERIEAVGRSVLESYTQLDKFYLGDEKGNFIMVRRDMEFGIVTEVLRQNGKGVDQYFRYLDKDGYTKIQTKSYDGYDPRTRPWYVGAVRTKESFWTDVYIFHSDQRPGITAAHPVYNKDGALLGVFGVDIHMGEISRVLLNQKVGQSGIVFILNQHSVIVGYPDISRLIRRDQSGYRSVHVTEMTTPWIRDAYLAYEEKQTEKFVYRSGGKRYIAAFTPFPDSFGRPWRIGLIIPEDDFLGAIKRTNYETALISMAILLLAILLSNLFSRRISEPIRQLSEEAEQIKDFHLDEIDHTFSRISEILLLQTAMTSMKAGLAAFRKYVPAQLVRQLIESGVQAELGGQRQQLTVFFSDIEGFTSIAEQMDPESLMLYLSEYLDHLTNIIMDETGTVDKYIGDAIMAFWGAPAPDDQQALHACKAALRCQSDVKQLNEVWQADGKQPFNTRIGLHKGETIVGNLGSPVRMNYTAIGDTVNLASRLEGVNKVYGTEILVSESVYNDVADTFIFHVVDKVAVKGKKAGIRIYNLLGDFDADNGQQLRAYASAFNKGVDAYFAQQWDEALAIFKALGTGYSKLANQTLIGLYEDRCRLFKKESPGSDWDGVFRLSVK